MAQADLTAFRWVRVATGGARGATPPSTTAPDITLSPFAPSKMPTTGMGLMLQAPADNPAATPNAGGFTLQVWLRDPTTKRYAAFAAITIDYQQLFVTFDIDAGELFFEVTGVAVNGVIDIGIAEQ